MRQAGSSGESQVVTWLCLGCGLPNSFKFLQIPPLLGLALKGQLSALLPCGIQGCSARHRSHRASCELCRELSITFLAELGAGDEPPCMGITPRAPCTAPHVCFPWGIYQDQQGAPAGCSPGGVQRFLLLLASSGP